MSRTAAVLTKLLSQPKDAPGLTLHELEQRFGPGTYAAAARLFSLGLIDCTAMPGDRGVDTARKHTLPPRARFRTYTLSKRGEKYARAQEVPA